MAIADVDPRRFVAPGAQLGRYTLQERLGIGGMGVVYAARDPELGRRVAIKLVRPGAGRAASAARLMDEARAMAKLSHPNVVPVYDVGQVEGNVFVAMELVGGPTLLAWQRETPRSWREVVTKFVEAGRGLAAAHAAGIVHRDFKPHNVLVDARGCAQVTDFGLAQASGDEPDGEQAHGGLSDHTPARQVVGSPPYMAPEQHTGAAATAASDQFSFCVALFEALYGVRPFAGPTPEALHRQKAAGEIEPVDPGEIPPVLARAVRRGLAPSPPDRHPDLPALVRRLERVLGPPISARVGLALAAASAAAGVALLVAQRGPVCDRGQEHLTGVWDEEQRLAVEVALRGAALPLAEETWGRTAARFDALTKQWLDAREEVCGGGLDERTFDVRLACLDQRLDELRALAQVLASADEEVVIAAGRAVAELPLPSICLDLARSRAAEPPADVRLAEQVRAQRGALQSARALSRAGHYGRGRELAMAVVSAADGLGYEPLRPEALVVVGLMTRKMGRYAAAATKLEEAFLLASELGHDAVTAEAATLLTRVFGVDLARREQGLQWARHASAAVARGAGSLAEAKLLHTLAVLHHRSGWLDAARDHHERALAIQTAELGEEHLRVAVSLEGLALVALEQGDVEQAQAGVQRVLQIRRAALGPDHPDVAAAHTNLGVAFAQQGRLEEADRHLRRSLEILEASLGPEHDRVAGALSNVASVAYENGDPETALKTTERALSIVEGSFGPDHPRVAQVLQNLGGSLEALQRFDEAIAIDRRALSIFERHLGPTESGVAPVLYNLGNALAGAGRYDEARAYFVRARDVLADAPQKTGMQRVLHGLARCALAVGNRAEAVRLAREGIALAEGPDGAGLVAGYLHFILAQALWPRDGASEAAERARELFVGQRAHVQLQQVDDWLEDPSQ